MEFYCQQNLVEDLKESAKKMEEELEKWKEEVRNARNDFQELNYYTTHQLLVLRSELGKLKAPVPPPYQRAQVMALLQSISLDVTPNDVERVVAMKKRKTTDRGKPALVAVKSSSSASYQLPPVSCSPTNLSEVTFVSVDAQKPHSEKDTSVKSAVVELSTRDLDTKQLESFRNFTKKYRYHEQFVLRAIKVCGTGDWYEIMNWIQNNMEEMGEMLQSVASDDSEGDSEGEEEEEEEKEKQCIIFENSQEEEVMVKVSPPGVYMYILHTYVRMYDTTYL